MKMLKTVEVAEMLEITLPTLRKYRRELGQNTSKHNAMSDEDVENLIEYIETKKKVSVINEKVVNFKSNFSFSGKLLEIHPEDTPEMTKLKKNFNFNAYFFDYFDFKMKEAISQNKMIDKSILDSMSKIQKDAITVMKMIKELTPADDHLLKEIGKRMSRN